MIGLRRIACGVACSALLGCDPVLTVRGRVASTPEARTPREARGSVYAAGRPLPGARVSVTCGDVPARLLAESDEHGWFRHTSIGYLHRDCRLLVEKTGHFPQAFTVEDVCAVRDAGSVCYAVSIQAELVPLLELPADGEPARPRAAAIRFEPLPATLTLMRAVETAPDLVAYTPVCSGRCEASIAHGEHVFAAALPGRSPTRLGAAVGVSGPTTIRVHYHDRETSRTLRRYVGAPAFFGGVALLLAASVDSQRPATRAALAGSGLGLLAGVGILVALSDADDEVSVEMVPWQQDDPSVPAAE